MSNKNQTERPIQDVRIGQLPVRLTAAIGEMSIRAIADKAGVSEGTVRNLLGGGTPRLDNILRIADATGVSASWLTTGEGSMRPGEEPEATPGVMDEEFALVTVYDVRASAGHGAAIDQERPLADIAFRRDWLFQEGLSTRGLAAVTADGDSMEPTIKDGSLLLLDTQQRELAGNRIYILRMDGHLYAKRLQRLTDGSIRVSSDNPAYADEVVDKEDAGQLDIIGRVVWVGRRL